jgi:hypothetical protein
MDFMGDLDWASNRNYFWAMATYLGAEPSLRVEDDHRDQTRKMYSFVDGLMKS